MKRFILLLLLALSSGCACHSNYFHSCRTMTWREMCDTDVACRSCMKDEGKEEKGAEVCWKRINQ